MGMRESDFFSLIGTQHFGKLFSPDGENVACDDYGSFLQLQYWEIYNVHTGYVHIAILSYP